MKNSLKKFAVLLRDCWYGQLLTLASVIALFYWVSKREDPAGWVQAIGSLIGIGIAIYVPHKLSEADRKDRHEAKMKEVCAIAISCYDEVDKLHYQIVDCIKAAMYLEQDPQIATVEHDYLSKIEILLIPTQSSLRAIQDDWDRFKIAPKSLQTLIHQINELNRKTIRARNHNPYFNFDALQIYARECTPVLNRIAFTQQQTFDYFRTLLAPPPPTNFRVLPPVPEHLF